MNYVNYVIFVTIVTIYTVLIESGVCKSIKHKECEKSTQLFELYLVQEQ